MKKIFKAFTVLELIIVVVIIGILSAVVYIGYGGIQAQARDASVLSDLDTLDGLMTDYALRNNVVGKAVYLEGGVTDTDLDFTPSEGNIIDAVIDSSDYCLRGYNPNGTKTDITVAFEKESSEGACDRIPPSALAVGSSGITVTGGTETIDGSYTIRTFTSSGTLSVTNGTLTGVNVLIVGGGANGQRGGMDYGGAGGNGGQVVSLTNQSITGDVAVVIGVSNQASSFGLSSALAGGGATGGASVYWGLGNPGANGVTSSITGTTIYYGGGGGAGSFNGVGANGGLGGGGKGGDSTEDGSSWGTCYNGVAGLANTGGGGGGSGAEGVNWCDNVPGGSGVVIVRYLTP